MRLLPLPFMAITPIHMRLHMCFPSDPLHSKSLTQHGMDWAHAGQESNGISLSEVEGKSAERAKGRTDAAAEAAAAAAALATRDAVSAVFWPQVPATQDPLQGVMDAKPFFFGSRAHTCAHMFSMHVRSKALERHIWYIPATAQ